MVNIKTYHSLCILKIKQCPIFSSNPERKGIIKIFQFFICNLGSRELKANLSSWIRQSFCIVDGNLSCAFSKSEVLIIRIRLILDIDAEPFPEISLFWPDEHNL